jgi:ATP-dependent protease ClpP protease subunit
MQGQVADLSIIGDIDWWNNNSADFTRQLNDLRAAGVTELRGYINSGGGSMWEANEIYNLIAGFPGRKTCRLGALVASAATTIACAFADGIEMAANGQYMIHNPNIVAQGGEKEFKAALQLYQNVRQGAIAIYVQRTGLPAEEISAMMEATTWMDAPTAKANGFITAISGEVAELPSDTAAVLNKYHYAGVPSVLNQVLSGAAPRPVLPTTHTHVSIPANRAGWTVQDYMDKAPKELQMMAEQQPAQFSALVNAAYPQVGKGHAAQPTAPATPRPASTTAPANRAGWKLADWHRNDAAGLEAQMQAHTPLAQQLWKQHYGTEKPAPSGMEPLNSRTGHGHAPVNTTAPATNEPGAEPPRRSLLEQRPDLGPLLTVLLDTAGKALTALPGDRITTEPRQLLTWEKVAAEGLQAAMGMVTGTEAAIYLLGALGVVDLMAEEGTNPVRRAVAREGGMGATDWADYRERWKSVASNVQRAEVAAQELTAANYTVAPAPKGREKWTMQDWMDKDPNGLRALREENPNLFQQLYRERFGIDATV